MTRSAEDIIALVLRAPDSAAALGELPVAEILSAMTAHGVLPLTRRALAARGIGVPPELREALDAGAREAALFTAWQRRAAARVLDELHRAGTPSLVLKGAALSHTHYSAPYLRPHCDTDILVRRSDVTQVAERLAALGYRPCVMVDRALVHTQLAFEWRDGRRAHYVDLHWAISSRPLFAEMATFEELMRDARPVLALGEGAATVSPVWSLLIACIHRVAHHDDSSRLLWLYSIKLIAEGLSPADWTSFWTLAAQKGVVDVCAKGLDVAAAKLDCLAPVQRGMSARPRMSARHPEPAAAFLGGGKSKLQTIVLDLRAVRGFGAKIRLLASHLFPDAAYMREAFGATTTAGLCAAYVRRAAVGAWRSVSPSGGLS